MFSVEEKKRAALSQHWPDGPRFERGPWRSRLERLHENAYKLLLRGETAHAVRLLDQCGDDVVQVIFHVVAYVVAQDPFDRYFAGVELLEMALPVT